MLFLLKLQRIRLLIIIGKKQLSENFNNDRVGALNRIIGLAMKKDANT